jgi:hypothetical protein
MDLLRMIQQNRQAQIEVKKAPVEERSKMKKVRGTPSSLPQPAEDVPGTKMNRLKIIEDKPSKKKVKEHLEALIAFECESSDED